MNERVFIPGSEWLYFKIYTGSPSIDGILVNNVIPFIRQLKLDEIIDEAFFVRYADPEIHIRLRLHLKQFKFTEVFQLFYQYFNSLVTTRRVWNIQCDTYKRELERYGDYTIKDVERLFDIDSHLIIRFIQTVCNTEETEENRFLFSMVLIDWFLNLCDYSIKQKHSYIHSSMEIMLDDLKMNNSKYFKILNNRSRIYRTKLERAFVRDEWITLLNDYKESIKAILFDLNRNIKCNTLILSKERLIMSLIHMMLDRLFVSNNKLYELLSYYILEKYYRCVLYKE